MRNTIYGTSRWSPLMMGSAVELGDLREFATILADRHNADILVYRGDITRAAGDQMTSGRPDRPRRQNVFLVLSTLGGSAKTAYRVARALQRCYDRFTVCIDDYCKTAGALLALGADELVMSDFGELGPLDAQLKTPVELGTMSSSLTAMQSLDYLRQEVLAFFQHQLAQLREQGGLTARLSAERASEMVTGLFSPIYAQIDPMQLGEVHRGMTTSRNYGARIGTANLKDGALEKLVAAYPSHDFVIDRDEARELFRRVREPTTDEAELLKYLEPLLALPSNQSRFVYLDELLTGTADAKEDDQGESGEADTPAAPATEEPEASS